MDTTDPTVFVATWRAVSPPQKRIVPPIALQPLHHAFTASLPTATIWNIATGVGMVCVHGFGGDRIFAPSASYHFALKTITFAA